MEWADISCLRINSLIYHNKKATLADGFVAIGRFCDAIGQALRMMHTVKDPFSSS